MSNFKPSIRINLRNFRSEQKTYPTYKELRRNLIKHLLESYDSEATVSRSKRGEWGEWFEIWRLDFDGKSATIIKQGWM
jgi:hypothetical protein